MLVNLSTARLMMRRTAYTTMTVRWTSTIVPWLRCHWLFLPALKASKGHIIYSSSVSTLYPMAPGWSAYHASKSAANTWCETADSEFAPLGVHVQIAYLPLVHTAMSDVSEQYKHTTCLQSI